MFSKGSGVLFLMASGMMMLWAQTPVSSPSFFVEASSAEKQAGVVGLLQVKGRMLQFTRQGLVLAPPPTQGDRSSAHLGKTAANIGMTWRAEGPRKAAPKAHLRKQLPGRFNALVGPRDTWRINQATYTEMVYEDAWSGVDLAFAIENRQLSMKLRLDAGVGSDGIVLETGAIGFEQGANGSLTAVFGDYTLALGQPQAHQMINGEKHPVAMRLRPLENGRFTVETLGVPPVTYETEITVTTTWITYFGGDDNARFSFAKMVKDSAGNFFFVGEARSVPSRPLGAPIEGGAFSENNNHEASYVAKYSPDASEMLAFTFLGGSSRDRATNLAIDDNDQVVITGYTESDDFPVTPGAYDTTFSGTREAFVMGLSNDLSTVEFATYFGGDGGIGSVIRASGGRICILGGMTDDYPFFNAYSMTGTRTGTCFDATATNLIYATGLPNGQNLLMDDTGAVVSLGASLTKLNPDGTLAWLREDINPGFIDLDATFDDSGNIYTVGYGLEGFITTPFAVIRDRNANAPPDIRVPALAKFDGNGNRIYSTYVSFGVNGSLFAVDVDPSGNAYVVGGIVTNTVPITAGAHDVTFNGGEDGFIIKLTPDGALFDYASWYGESETDFLYDIIVEADGSAKVMAFTTIDDPESPVDLNRRDTTRVRMLNVNPTGSEITTVQTFTGTSFERPIDLDMDSMDNTLLTGVTNSPTLPGVNQGFLTRNTDAFISKISADATTLLYTTVVGGGGNDMPQRLVVDSADNMYLLVDIRSGDFNSARGAESGRGIYVVKISADGTTVPYVRRIDNNSTYLWTGFDVNDAGEVFLAGFDFILSQPISRFVKLDAGGSMVIDEQVQGVLYSQMVVRDQDLFHLRYLDDAPTMVYRNFDGDVLLERDMPYGLNKLSVGADGGYVGLRQNTSIIDEFNQDGELVNTVSLTSAFPIDIATNDRGMVVATTIRKSNTFLNFHFNAYLLKPSGSVVELFTSEERWELAPLIAANTTNSISFVSASAGYANTSDTPGVLQGLYLDLDLALINVDACGAFTVDPKDELTVCEGRLFTMTLDIHAAEYQWMLDGVEIPGANDYILDISRVSLDDNGLFSCRLTFDCGLEEVVETTDITVQPNAVIVQQPVSESAVLGGSVTFTSEAIPSRGDVRYQWRKDLINLPGETGPQLTLNNICPLDAGAYTVAVFDACNTGTISVPAVLTVLTEGLNLLMSPATQSLGPQPAVFEANIPCFDEGGIVDVSVDPSTPFTVNGQTITLIPSPLVNTTITASYTDSSGVTVSTTGTLLVAPNMGFTDPDGDGCSGLADFLMTLPSWNSAGVDADNSGFINVLDLLYLNPFIDCD